MTSFIEEEKVTAALEAGASGYVLKDAEAEEVAAAIRAAYAGEVHLDPAVARLLAQRMRNRKSPEDLQETPDLWLVSARSAARDLPPATTSATPIIG